MATVNTATSFSVSSQAPLDIKRYFVKLSELRDLGQSNNKAFRYYDRMEVDCIETKKKYLWRERTTGDTDGILDIDFVYPNGVKSNDIDYSNKAYNFFEIIGTESYLSLKDVEDANYNDKRGYRPEVSPSGHGLRLTRSERYFDGYYVTQETYSESFAVGNVIRGICKKGGLDVLIEAEILSLPFENDTGLIPGSLKFYIYNESF